MASSTAEVTTVEVTTLNSTTDDVADPNNNALQIVTATVLALIMLGLGCSVTYQSMWHHIKRPKQFIVALLLQLVLMPFLGFGLSRAVQMTDAQTIGVLVMASSPGGAYSNIVAYWMDGDMDLSIVMTTASTLIALGTMPLWLYVFPTIMQTDDTLAIPFDQLGYALIGIVIPVFVGTLIKYKFPKKSEIVTKVCSVVGSLAIIIMVVVFAILNKVEYEFSWRQILVAILLPGIALALGYLATLPPWLKFSIAARRTIAIETAMQSSAVGTSIVIRSFDYRAPNFNAIFLFPVMYAAVQLFVAFASVMAYLLLKRRGVNCVQPVEEPLVNGVELAGNENPAYDDGNSSRLPSIHTDRCRVVSPHVT